MRIREVRMQNSVSQKDLAVAIGVAPNTLSQYENGKRAPDFDTLMRISDYFHVSVDYLLGRDEQQKKPTPKDGDGLSETARQIMDCVNQMSPKEQETFLAWLQTSQGRS